MVMIICIAGYAGSGKDTAADMLSEKLGLPRVKFTFKDMAAERGMALMEFHKLASADGGKIDKEFDRRVVEVAHKLDKKEGGCIVSTWIGAWMVKDAALRVFLRVPEEVRAKRLTGRDNMAYGQALEHIRERDANNKKRYMKYYGIDITDLSVFDLIIDADENTQPKDTLKIIMDRIKQLKKK